MPAHKSAPPSHKATVAAKAPKSAASPRAKPGALTPAAAARKAATSRAKAAAATADSEMSEMLQQIRVKNDELGTRIDALLARIG